jgi:hypothetical protein
MTFFANAEKILKQLSARNLKQMEYYYGIPLELYRAVKDVHTDVYGTHAGTKVVKVTEFVGILISDDFFPSAPGFAGNFEEGFLYTTSKEVLVADVIRIKAADGKNRRFKVATKETLGTQDSVFERFKLTNFAD